MVKLFKDNDNAIRSAVEETNNSLNKTHLRRPIERLYLLEIHTNIDTEGNNDIEVEINRQKNTTFTYDERPTRAAEESGTLIRRLANQT